MLTGFLVTIIACSVEVGGLTNVFRMNIEHGRKTFFDFRPNPTIRHSFWSVFFGLGIMATSYIATNQIIVQRYLTCRSLRQSQFAAGLGTVIIGLIEILAVLSGMSMYAYFAGCDPLTSGKVQSADQLMAYIMVELFGKAPGIAGLLISAAFSASLSTVSSGVNALATITGQDIIQNIWPGMDDFKFTLILKCISILFGVICIGMAFLASIMEAILPLTLSLIGILNGPILGVFCLGIYCPFCNSKGAVVGMVCAVVLGFWLKIGAMIYPPFLDDPPLFVDQCPVLSKNVTEAIISDWSETTTFANATEGMPVDRPGIANLYSISYAYYSPLTCFTTIIVGSLFSLVTGGNGHNTVDPRLISPWSVVFCCCLPRKWKAALDGEFKKQFSSANKGDFVPVNLQMERYY